MKTTIYITFLLFSLKLVSQPVYVITTGGDLYSIELGNCTSRYVGSTSLGYADIAFTPDGVLWGFVDSNIYRIDTTTANCTLIGNTGIDAISLVALNDTTLLAESDFKLFGISTNSATSFYIDTIGHWALGDLTWYDEDLYLTTSFRLIKIEMNTGGTEILSVSTVNEKSNPTINCEGTATSAFVNDYNSIIGFSGRNAFKICHLDGTSTLLCDSLTHNNIAGGASMRLPAQVPEPKTCHLQTAVTDFNPEINILDIYPNPVGKSSSIQISINDKFEFPFEVSILSLDGRLILSRSVPFSTPKIEIELKHFDFPSGLFVIVLKNSTHKFQSLVVVE